MNDDRQQDHTDDDPKTTDVDTLPGAPGRSDTPLGDTDQLSDAGSPPAQTG